MATVIRRSILSGCLVATAALLAQASAHAQAAPAISTQDQQGIDRDIGRHFGDAPANPGPKAKLSGSLHPADVRAATRKVADWELAWSQPYFDRIWTWSVLYTGFMAASDSLGDPKYRDAMTTMAQKFDWKLKSHLPNADDQSVAQTYLELYFLKKDPAMITPTQQELDAILAAPRESTVPGKEIAWWWCDALFMAPPVWSRMYAATGDRKYIDYLDEEWAKTSARLYDNSEHLYFRDYLSNKERGERKKDVLVARKRLGDGRNRQDVAISTQG